MSRYLELKKRALMMAANKWWQPSGISIDQCIAAYRFKGADSMASALLDVTEHGWNLETKGADGVSWDTVNGMYSTGNGYYKSASLSSVKGGYNDSGRAIDSLAYQDVRTAIVWYYTGWRAVQFEDHTNGHVWACCAGFSHGLGYMSIQQGFVNSEYNQYGAQGYHFTNKPSIALISDSVKMLDNNNAFTYHNGAVMGASWGITSVNWNSIPWAEQSAYWNTIDNSNNIYFNGVKMTGTERTHVDSNWANPHDSWWDNSGKIFDLSPFYTNHKADGAQGISDAVYASDCMMEGEIARGPWVKPRILAASFYSVVLNDAQHDEVYRNMLTL